MGKPIKPVVSIAVIVAVLGAVGAAAFYQDEVTGFVRLQGWNTAPITHATQDFVQAASKNDGTRVATLVAPEASGIEPVRKGDAVVAFMMGEYGGTKRRRVLRELCPNDQPQIASPKLVYLNGGSATVDITYPGKHMLRLSWDRKPDQWKLVRINMVD